jgi:hypothetical protein
MRSGEDSGQGRSHAVGHAVVGLTVEGDAQQAAILLNDEMRVHF